MPAAPDGWTWNREDLELVCPDCQTPDDGHGVLGTIVLTRELEQDVLEGADARTLREAEALRRLTSGEDDVR